MKKLKIVLDSEYQGLDSGWPNRYIGLISELHSRHQLTIYAPGDTRLLENRFPKARFCHSTVAGSPRPPFTVIRMLKQLLLPCRYDIELLDSPYSNDLHRAIMGDKKKYDASVYFEMASFVYYGEGDSSPLVICDFCDSRVRSARGRWRSRERLRDHVRYFYDLLYIRRIKRKYIPPEVVILASTQTDANCIATVLNRNRIFVIPNGIDPLDVRWNEDFFFRKYMSPYIVFVGSLNYRPNEDSVMYSLQYLWPEIHKAFPHLIFRIVGRSPTPRLKDAVRQMAGVELVGPIEDVYKCYLESKLLLSPIFSGAGIKNKFLESLNAGTPVVTTLEGALGIDMVNNRHGRICRKHSDLLQETLSLLSCTFSEYVRMSHESRTLARKYYWNNVGRYMDEILADIQT